MQQSYKLQHGFEDPKQATIHLTLPCRLFVVFEAETGFSILFNSHVFVHQLLKNLLIFLLFLVYYPEIPMKSSVESKAKAEETDQITSTSQQPSTTEGEALITKETFINQSRKLRALSLPAFAPTFADSPASLNPDNQVRISVVSRLV